MARTTPPRIESNLAIHPGELLAEELEFREMSQKQLALEMGRPPQAINEIVRGKKAITAETAVQLERALKIPAHLWMNLQTTYDIKQARQAERDRATA